MKPASTVGNNWFVAILTSGKVGITTTMPTRAPRGTGIAFGKSI